MKRAVIFDMDGTLCDVSSIRHLVEGPKRNFPVFHLASAHCPPHEWVVNEARKAHQDGYIVCILTGRMNEFRSLTTAWLKTHDVPFRWLLMRENGDFRKDVIIKEERLQFLQDTGYVVIHAWDDNPNIIALWESKGIPVTVVPGWTGQ